MKMGLRQLVSVFLVSILIGSVDLCGTVLSKNVPVHQSPQQEFVDYFVTEITRSFMFYQSVFLPLSTQEKLAGAIAGGFTASAKSDTQPFVTSIKDDQTGFEFHITIDIEQAVRLAELEHDLFHDEIGERAAAIEKVFVLDESRSLLRKNKSLLHKDFIAQHQPKVLEDAVESLISLIRAETGFAIAPYFVKEFTLDPIAKEEQGEQLVNTYALHIACVTPTVADKMMFVKNILSRVTSTYNHISQKDRSGKDIAAPLEELNSVLTLLKRANASLQYSEIAGKRIAAFSHLVAQSYPNADLDFVCESLHEASCGELSAFMQDHVLKQVKNKAQLDEFSELLRIYSDGQLKRVGLINLDPEAQSEETSSRFLFNEEQVKRFCNTQMEQISFLDAELTALEENALEKIWDDVRGEA